MVADIFFFENGLDLCVSQFAPFSDIKHSNFINSALSSQIVVCSNLQVWL